MSKVRELFCSAAVKIRVFGVANRTQNESFFAQNFGEARISASATLENCKRGADRRAFFCYNSLVEGSSTKINNRELDFCDPVDTVTHIFEKRGSAAFF